MANFRIVCTTQLPADKPPQHAHIVSVGVGDEPTRYTKSFTLKEVINSMAAGNKFYTQGITTGKIAFVEKYICSHCNQWHIKSAADAVHDNNLDSLPYCQR
jgi:hypothetical protein